MHKRSYLLVGILVGVLILAACSDSAGTSDGGGQAARIPDLTIVSGSENRTLEPIIQAWATENNKVIEIEYLGSLDIMLDLQDGEIAYDAVWPANSIWLSLGDEQDIVKSDESILRSPVVLGIKESVANDLGWIGRTDITTVDILEAAENGEFQMYMTSATQSNSGASAYLAFLYAFAGQPNVLTSDDLNNEDVREQVRRILAAVERSSGSSGWLKDLCLDQYVRCDAMFNYEALIIEANQELVARGDEPLYAIYPADGLAIADSPLGFVDKGSTEKEALFDELQAYLLSEEIQTQLLDRGRRTGLVGLNVDDVNTNVFNPDWGIDVNQVFQAITFPRPDVLQEALFLYQTALRKPSFTIYALDFSGSMDGAGEDQLKEAMTTLLDQDLASQYLLQASPDDVTVVLIFSDRVQNGTSVTVLDEWIVYGNDEATLRRLRNTIQAFQPSGGTNIYDPVQVAMGLFNEIGIGNRFPAVILMTDGQSNTGSFEEMRRRYESTASEFPVFAITFGQADRGQLEEITELTFGRIFDGSSDLIGAFRSAKGYN